MNLKELLDILSKEKVSEDIRLEFSYDDLFHKFEPVDVQYEGRGPKLIIFMREPK